MRNANLLVEDQGNFERQINETEGKNAYSKNTKSKFGRLTVATQQTRTGSAITLDRTETVLSDRGDDDQEESTKSSEKQTTESLEEFMVKYKKIQTWHVRSVLLYWICTIAMLIECFVLFVIVVTPAVLKFPEEYEFLKAQEIALFLLALL